MPNNLQQVAGLSTGAQVLTGEITPPTVGVNDYSFRLLPGAELAPVGQTPATLTEVVTGDSIPKLHALAESIVSVDAAGRYCLEQVRGVGYGTTAQATQTRTTFLVAAIPASFPAGFFAYAGTHGFFVDGGRKFIAQDLASRGNTGTTGAVTASPGVYTVAARGSQTLAVAPDGSSTLSSRAVGTQGQFSFGTNRWADAQAGARLYDVICYDRELSDLEILTVRQALQAIWATVPVGGITWKK